MYLEKMLVNEERAAQAVVIFRFKTYVRALFFVDK